MEGLEAIEDDAPCLARLVVRLVGVVRMAIESRPVRVKEREALRDGGNQVVGHGHGEVRLDDDAEHGRRRVRVVEEVVRLLGDRVPASRGFTLSLLGHTLQLWSRDGEQ